jgi:predicted nucleotidyltransferase
MNLTNSKKIEEICQQNGITYLGLFGSHARGEENTESDVDLLVEFNETKSLFQLSRLERKFEELLNKTVDLVPRKNIKESIKPYILNDLQLIYEKK